MLLGGDFNYNSLNHKYDYVMSVVSLTLKTLISSKLALLNPQDISVKANLH